MAGRTKGMMSLLIQSCVIHALFKPTICSRSYSLPFFFCLAVFLPSRARHGPHVTRGSFESLRCGTDLLHVSQLSVAFGQSMVDGLRGGLQQSSSSIR